MKSADGCAYQARIPASATSTDVIHYYITAYDDGEAVVASNGNSGSPNLIDVVAGEPIEPPVTVKRERVYILLGAGLGAGYVTGVTEKGTEELKTDGFAPNYLHLAPRTGLLIGKTLGLGLYGRFGFPIGATAEGHSTMSPSAGLRLRKFFGAFNVAGSVGAGVVSDTIEINDAVHVISLGPLQVGAGAGVRC